MSGWGWRALLLVWATGVFTPLLASQIDVYRFDDAQQKTRYQALIAELRCPKCLNTNLAGSDAPIAQDLRAAVHRLVVQEGFTDQQVRDWLQARYGDFVLYDPPFTARTWLVWVLPIGLLLVGLGLLLLLQRRGRQVVSAPLSDAQKAHIRDYLER
ncbi:MAG: cytochrome c-type biogenesis protein [Pseudomonadota bacterium]